MAIAEKIIGTYVILRNVMENDAEFILSLRCDEKKNKYIHAVDNDVDKEMEWIKKQQLKQGDYFYTIVSRRGEPIGNISLYNFDYEKKEVELGRWVSKGAAIENLESVVVLHDYAFNKLRLKRVYTKTLQNNKQVVNFWKRFGGMGREYYRDGEDVFFYNIIENREWEKLSSKFSKVLGG